MAILKLSPNAQLKPEDDWAGKTGQLVEDYVCRSINNLENKDAELSTTIEKTAITNVVYDSTSLMLLLNNKKGETVAKGKVTVIEPKYTYGLYIYGLKYNGKVYTAADGSITTQYTSTTDVRIGIALYSIATIGEEISNIAGTYNVKIHLGSKSAVYDIGNTDYNKFLIENGLITGMLGNPEEAVTWIPVIDLFKVSQRSVIISAEALDIDSKLVAKAKLEGLVIQNDVISLTYSNSGSCIVNTNSALFNLQGGTTSEYHLTGFNNGLPFDTPSGNLNYTELTPGLNQIMVKAVNNKNLGISTDYIYLDLIYTEGCDHSVVAINGVSQGISNNGVTNLYKLNIYSPELKNVKLETYLVDNEPDKDLTLLTEKDLIKYEVVNASSYGSDHVFTTTYTKYIEIDSYDSKKFLAIKIDGKPYKFYSLYTSGDGAEEAITYNYQIMNVDAVDPNLLYCKSPAPLLNFDQINGYLNNVFVTKDYATPSNPATIIEDLETSDGWVEENNRVYFRASAQNKPLFVNPKEPSRHDLPLKLDNQFTIELGFKTFNVSNEDTPILTWGEYQLRPSQFCKNLPILSEGADDSIKESIASFNALNSRFLENEEIHLVITCEANYKLSKDDVYYPKYLDSFLKDFDNNIELLSVNLMKIYVNGVIDREIDLGDNLDNMKNAPIILSPRDADIDFYIFRVYDNYALTAHEVQKNYISSLLKKEDKLDFFNRNDILKDPMNPNNSEISFNNSRTKYNTLVYVYPTVETSKGPVKGRFPNRAWGGSDKSDENPDGPKNDVDKKIGTTLFIGYANPDTNREYGGRIINGRVKGQGSSAMKYLIWNVTYQLNKLKKKVTDPITLEEKEVKINSEFTQYKDLNPETNKFNPEAKPIPKYYKMPPYDGQLGDKDIQITKLVGKVNYASSMQSHKVGACKLFDDAYRNAKMTPMSGGLKAVHEEPFLYFYWETNKTQEEVNNLELADLIENDADIHFMGFQTWGSGKGDDATSGYDENITPEYLLVEGGENTDAAANFRIPWLELQRANADTEGPSGKTDKDGKPIPNYATPEYKLASSYPTVTSAHSLEAPWDRLYIFDESIVYNSRGSWDVDFGCHEKEIDDAAYFKIEDSAKPSLKKFREFYDFVYKHDFNIKIETRAITQEVIKSWSANYKYVVTLSECDLLNKSHQSGDIYRYCELAGVATWVPAGTVYNEGSGWERLNIYTLTGESRTEQALRKLKDLFKAGIKEYIDVSDIAFHLAYIRLISGTDNRAKNTYFLIIGHLYEPGLEMNEDNEPIYVPNGKGDYKVRLLQDDVDSILMTDNNGLQSKPYNIIETSYKDKDKIFWGDANNIFFYMFDLAFEEEIRTQLTSMISFAFTNLDVNNKGNYFYKVLFGVLENFPAVAYNHTAKIYYENSHFILKTKALTGYTNNNVAALEQSHGSCLSCEKQYMTLRFNLLSTYAGNFDNNKAKGLDTGSTGGAGSNNIKLRIEYEPYLDFYPALVGSSTFYFGDFFTKEQQRNNTGFKILDSLAETGKSYTTNILIVTQLINQQIPMVSLFKKLHLSGLKTSKINTDFAHATDFILDNADVSKYPGIFDEDYLGVNLTEFNSSFPVLENLSLKNMNLPSYMNFKRYLKLKTIDLKGSTGVTEIVLPLSGRLTSVTLPKSITTFKIYNNPNLDNVIFESYDNLETVFVDCAKCAKFDIESFCLQLLKCNSLKEVILRNCNMSLSEEVLVKLINTKTCQLTGEITIIDSYGSPKDISFDLKQSLVNKFGNITQTLTKQDGLQIHYKESAIRASEFTIAQEISIYRLEGDGDTVIRANKFDINIRSGNDVKIINEPNPYNPKVIGRLDISYKLSCSADIAEVDAKGTINLKLEVSYPVTATVTIVTNTGKFSKEARLNFTWKAPKIGDLAYADGTFSEIYDDSKTCVGIVFAQITSSDSEGFVYVLGKEYAQPGEDMYYLGYDTYSVVGESNDLTVKDLSRVTLYLKDSQVVSGYESIETTDQTLLNEIKVYDRSTRTGYNDESTDSFTGLVDTKAYVDKVNKDLFIRTLKGIGTISNHLATNPEDGSYYIANIEQFDKVRKALKDANKSNLPESDIMECLLYPYFYSTYLYEPLVDKGTLNTQYSKYHWYVPSVGEWTRILYYRGYSAKGEDFKFSSQIMEGVDKGIRKGSGVLKQPIFSLALGTMGRFFPTEWSELSNCVSSNINVTATTSNDGNKYNIAYRKYSDDYNSADKYEWIQGEYTSGWAGYGILEAKKLIWRLRKFKTLPIVKFHYTKVNAKHN